MTRIINLPDRNGNPRLFDQETGQYYPMPGTFDTGHKEKDGTPITITRTLIVGEDKPYDQDDLDFLYRKK